MPTWYPPHPTYTISSILLWSHFLPLLLIHSSPDLCGNPLPFCSSMGTSAPAAPTGFFPFSSLASPKCLLQCYLPVKPCLRPCHSVWNSSTASVTLHFLFWSHLPTHCTCPNPKTHLFKSPFLKNLRKEKYIFLKKKGWMALGFLCLLFVCFSHQGSLLWLFSLDVMFVKYFFKRDECIFLYHHLSFEGFIFLDFSNLTSRHCSIRHQCLTALWSNRNRALAHLGRLTTYKGPSSLRGLDYCITWVPVGNRWHTQNG